MTFAEAISFGLDALDIVDFAFACFALAHSRFARGCMRTKRHACSAHTERLCNPAPRCVVATTQSSKGGANDMEGVVESTPVETTFITQMCRVEDVGEGMMLSSFCAPVAGKRVLRARFLIPISCGAVMNIHGTEVFARALRSYPDLVRKLMQF